MRHPSLGVPVCKACKDFYFDGSWCKDSEGKFDNCGWCAQGGDLLCCSIENCPNSFCTKCIKRNLGRQKVSEIEDSDDWKCFECEPQQVKQLRLLYYSIYQFWQNVDEKIAKKEEKAKRKNRTDCITQTYNLAHQVNNLSKKFLSKNKESWHKNLNFDQVRMKSFVNKKDQRWV